MWTALMVFVCLFVCVERNEGSVVLMARLHLHQSKDEISIFFFFSPALQTVKIHFLFIYD
jgi:hypothetical protein